MRRRFGKPLVLLMAVVAAAGIWTASTMPAAAAFFGMDGKLVFWGNDGGPTQVYVMNPDGTGKTNLSNDPSVFEGLARWSRNGQQIVFSRLISGSYYNVYRMAADGSGVTRLTNQSSANDYFAAWTPTGKIIFQRTPLVDTGFGGECSRHSGLWVMNADGSHQHQITDPSLSACQPATTSRTTSVAFTGSRDGTATMQTFVINLDGTGLRQLSPPGTVFDFRPNWSSDGSRIMFLNGPAPSHLNLAIWTSWIDGSHRTQLLPGTPSWDSPVFSPDGQFIAMHSCTDDQQNVTLCRIFVAHSDGSGLTQLTFPAPGQFDANVDWQALKFWIW